MKIAIIGHKRIPSREGGIEIVVEAIATRLAAKGHTVHAYNRSGEHVSGKQFDATANEQVDKNRKNYRGVRLITVPTPPNRSLNAFVYSLLATIRALFGRYDVIHYHAEGPAAMCGIPRFFGIRTVATIHGLDWKRAKWKGFAVRYLRYGERMAARRAHVVTVLTQSMAQYFQDTYDRDTVVIPNGIEKADPVSDAVLARYGLRKDGYILYLARIVPEKGAHYLLEAFRKLSTDKKLVIAGGSSHTQDYMDSLRAMATSDDRILFTDFVQGEVMQSLYSNAYVYVLPSDLEGMPLTLMEAMSYGNCCLVSDIPEIVEVAGNHAEIFAHGDVHSLREKLTILLEDPQVVQAYRQSVAEYICARYNWDAIVKQFERVYRG